MKKIIFIIALIYSIFVFPQAPQAFNYQATIRNSNGLLLTNQNVVLRINIMLNSQTSAPVYSEIHSTSTDDLGYVSIVVGQGIPTTGTFNSINWSNGNYYLGIKLNSGNGEIPIGTSQLLSVPFAFHANTISSSSVNLASVLSSNNNGNNLQIKNIADPTDNKDAVNKNYLETRLNSLEAQINALTHGYIWQSQNLDVTNYRDGTPIPQVNDLNQWVNLTTGAWCYYQFDSTNGTTYGKLYNWYAVAGIHDSASLSDPNLRKELAPIGWHVPSDSEWTNYIDSLGGNLIAGGKMKEVGTIHWQSPNINATNESGFNALPGGQRNALGYFNEKGYYGNWWTKTEENSTNAFNRRLVNNLGQTFRQGVQKHMGFSVRCLMD